VKDLPDKRFDLCISNPPFGNDQVDKSKYNWLNYQGHRDLMALEIALRYSKWGYFILPQQSVPLVIQEDLSMKTNLRDIHKDLRSFLKTIRNSSSGWIVMA